MKISPSRRKIFKQNLRTYLLTDPRVDNKELAQMTGLHRNTVSKLINEIGQEDRPKLKKMWKKNLKILLDRGDICSRQLTKVFNDSYRSQIQKKPSQLVNIVNLNWKITRESYKEILKYLGIKEDPLVLSQINFGASASGSLIDK